MQTGLLGSWLKRFQLCYYSVQLHIKGQVDLKGSLHYYLNLMRNFLSYNYCLHINQLMIRLKQSELKLKYQTWFSSLELTYVEMCSVMPLEGFKRYS